MYKWDLFKVTKTRKVILLTDWILAIQSVIPFKTPASPDILGWLILPGQRAFKLHKRDFKDTKIFGGIQNETCGLYECKGIFCKLSG